MVQVLLGGDRVVLLPHGLQETILRGSAPEQNTLTILFNKFCSSDQFSSDRAHTWFAKAKSF